MAEPAGVCGLEVPPQSDLPVTVEVAEEAVLSAVAIHGEDGEKTAEVQIEKQEQLRRYKLTFLPPQKDKYRLEIKTGDSHVNGSPLHLDLRAPNAKGVTIAEPPAGKLKAGQPIKICFDTSNAGRGEMHSTCSGEEVGDIQVDVQRRGFTNKFDVTFKPPHEDEYVVHVKWAERSIKGSPFKIDLIPVNPNKVKASAPKIPSNPDDPIEMNISTKGAGNAKLTATCMGMLGGKIPVSVKKVAPHDYHLTVKPPDRDILSLSVQYGGKHIPNSPFLVNTLPVDASRVKVTEPENPEIGQLVSYKLNTLEAGAGVLSANCEGEKSGPVDIKITKEGATNNKHVASFTPQVADVYTVGIQWGDDKTEPKHVPGSPFKLPLLLPPDASKVKAGDLHVPAEAGDDEWVWLELDCSEAGHGEPSAVAKHEGGDQVEVKIEKIEDDKYKVKFKTEQAGKYSMAVLYDGSPIPGSPYSDIEILDLSPKPELVKHLETKQPEEKGGPATLLFDAKDAGKGEFRARVAGLLTGQTASVYELVPGSDHIYKVSFNPQLADTYLVDVYWEDHPVTDSPFYVEIIHPDEVIVTEPDKDSISLTRSFHFNVDASNAGPGKLTARCEIKEKGAEVDVIVEEDPDEADRYTVSVRPEEEGVYLVSILFDGHHVTGSPFEIDLVPKLISEAPCTLHELEDKEAVLDLPEDSSPPPQPPQPAAPQELEMFIGDPFSLVIDQESVDNTNRMTASAVGETTGPAVVHKKQDEGLSCFTFDPETADRYTVEIRMNGEVLGGNSYIISYIYPVDASKCVIFDADGLNENLPINEEISFGVDATRAGNGNLTVNVDGPASATRTVDVKVASSDEKPNVYRVSYLPTSRGTHKINLLWDGEAIPGSPIELEVGSLKDIPTFFLHEPFVIHFTTECDPKDVESYAIHDDSCIRYVFKIGRRKQGKLKLFLKAEKPGIHSIHVLIGGKEVNGSPFEVLFIESDPAACKVIDLPEKPSVGIETSFKVDSRKAGHADLHIKAKVPPGGKTDVSHMDHEDGLYSVIFTPRVTGPHRFHVLWANEAIPDTPVAMEILPADPEQLASQEAAAKVYIVKEDMAIFDKSLSITETAVFDVCAKDAGKGQLNVQATGPYKTKIRVDDLEDGTYRCTLQPKVAGSYLVKVLWNDFPIAGNPFELNFTNDKSYMINGLKLETDHFTVGTPREYTIDCGREKGAFKVECLPSSAANVELTRVEERENTYLCKIVPLIAGNHAVHVTYNEKHILDSPYIVQFYNEEHQDRERDRAGDEEEEVGRLSPLGSLHVQLEGDETAKEFPDPPLSPKPDKVRVYGPGLKSGYVGQEGNFMIETGEAGDGKLEVKVSGPKGSFKLNMRHHPDSDRTILAHYDPRYAGEYIIDVMWSDSPVPGSPFIVEISEQNQLVYTFTI